MPNAASDLIDAVVGPVNKVRRFIESIPTPPPMKDTTDYSWHDKMVKDATASFSRQQNSTAKAKKQGHSYEAAQAEHKKQAARK